MRIFEALILRKIKLKIPEVWLVVWFAHDFTSEIEVLSLFQWLPFALIPQGPKVHWTALEGKKERHGKKQRKS